MLHTVRCAVPVPVTVDPRARGPVDVASGSRSPSESRSAHQPKRRLRPANHCTRVVRSPGCCVNLLHSSSSGPILRPGTTHSSSSEPRLPPGPIPRGQSLPDAGSRPHSHCRLALGQTGMQALEGGPSDIPMRPANPVTREVEHIRHGTLSLMGAVRRRKLFGFVSDDHDSPNLRRLHGGQHFAGTAIAPTRDENRGRTCAIGTPWTKTNRPAVWLPAADEDE